MSSKKARSRKTGPLTKLVEERSDVTEEDLERFFGKQSDLHSPVWLLIVGLLLGGGGVGFFQLLRQAVADSSTLPSYLLLPYFILFLILIALVPAAIGLLVVYVVQYNPFSAQERITRDYLDARAKLREKSKPPKEEMLESKEPERREEDTKNPEGSNRQLQSRRASI